MSATDFRYQRARRQLETIEESWKEDHDEAMECVDFEEYLGLTIGLFQAFNDLTMLRREHIFRGEMEPNPELDATEKELYSRWVDLSDEMMTGLSTVERDFEVAGAQKFRECHALGKSRLASWTPARPSSAIGLRTHHLDEDDARELRAIIEDRAATGEGRAQHPPQPVPDASPDMLKRLRDRLPK